ncbi:hypothetical protein PSCICL_24080 [Pseudomonas cichorii]|nr:hypothetical protein PSCICL_24080 [Pseudomonas cichorii]
MGSPIETCDSNESLAISKTYKFINQQRSTLDVVWHTQASLSAMSIGFQVGNEFQ